MSWKNRKFSPDNRRNAFTLVFYDQLFLTWACKTLSSTKCDSGKMDRLERRVLIRIYGPVLEDEVYRKRTNRDVQLNCQKPGINAYLISERIEWALDVERLNKESIGWENRRKKTQRSAWTRVNNDLNKCSQKRITMENRTTKQKRIFVMITLFFLIKFF